MDRIELLSPAGDLERLKVTLLYGADAVYIGGEIGSLRANAVNFTISEIKEGCNFAHKLNKKVYLTLNIVFHNEEIAEIEDYIKKVVAAGIDAFIVSDPFIISYLVNNYPEVEVHLSTQNSTSNYKAVEFFKDEGVKRIVLARELSKPEIAEIIKKTKTDIEVFIHGAMCTCVSGRCALSNYVTGRDANRGGCAHSCRWKYHLFDGENIISNPNCLLSMSSKDLRASAYIERMIKCKIASLKI